jgi:uncharacterized delta-60 repeat protein
VSCGFRRRRAVLVCGLVLLCTGSASASPGDLDETFSKDGLLALGANRSLIDLAAAPDGSIWVAEQLSTYGTISRYSPGGEPVGLPATHGRIGAITAREDGRLLVGGAAPALPDDFSIAEAPGFQVTTDFAGGRDRLTDLIEGLSDTAVAAGLVTDGSGAHLGVARYLPSGALDGSFSGDGKLIFNAGGVDTVAEDAVVAVLPDGSILLAGAGPGPDGAGRGDFLLAKLEPDGDLDPGFGGGDGWVTLNLAGRDDAVSIAVAPDGAIVAGILACEFGLTTDCDPVIARFTAGGTLDAGFGSGGLSAGAPGAAIALGGDGSIYAVGESPTREYFGRDFALARYTPAGALDQSFSVDGIAIADFGLTDDVGLQIDVAADGRVVVGGIAGSGPGVARFEVAYGPGDADADGVLDVDDGCPERFAGHASGCPRIDRTIKVARAPGRRLEVRLKADLDVCSARQRIKVIRLRRGPDGSFARPRTSRRGIWRSSKAVPDGVYRAIAKHRTAPGLGRCSQAQSRARSIG